MKNKTCVGCNQKQSIKMFYKSKFTLDGIDYYCKECRKTSSLKSHRFGKQKSECTVEGCEGLNYAKNLCRIHYERNRRHGTTDLANYGRESYGSQSYETTRRNHLWHHFKITPEQYEEMAKDGCHICGVHALPHKKLHVDHDHKCCEIIYVKGYAQGYNTCGKCVRGILCDKCNQAVGRYEKGSLRPEYPNKEKIILYVAMHDRLISDRIGSYAKRNKGRR